MKKTVVAAVFQRSRHEEARDAAAGFRQREKAVGNGHRAEPFGTRQREPVGARTAVIAGMRMDRGRLWLPQVRAALLFRHRVANDHAPLGAHFRATEIVIGHPHPVGPDRQCRRNAQSHMGRVRHAGRAAGAMLDLIQR